MSRSYARAAALLPAALLTAALLAGCGGANGSGAPAGSRTVAYTLSGSKVDGPDRIEVDRGTTVTIEVTADRDDELHVHGYDEEVELSPGAAGRVTFVADEQGRFEVETHESGLTLATLVVR